MCGSVMLSADKILIEIEIQKRAVGETKSI